MTVKIDLATYLYLQAFPDATEEELKRLHEAIEQKGNTDEKSIDDPARNRAD